MGRSTVPRGRGTSDGGGARPAVLAPRGTPSPVRTPARPSVVAVGSAARFAERVRARRRLARRQLALIAAGVVVVAAAAWLLLLSPVLALDPEQVEVTGAGTVVAVDQVVAVVDTRAGVPLPRLDTVALRDKVLEVPGVREARVTRSWPHGLVVELVSREPVAAVPEPAEAGAGFALVDQDGVQVGRVDDAPEGLPVVDVPVGEARILGSVLAVLEALPPDLLAQVGAVSAQSQDTVAFTLRDGASVTWGSAQQTQLKIAVLAALRAAPETAASTFFDVSAPTMPVVG